MCLCRISTKYLIMQHILGMKQIFISPIMHTVIDVGVRSTKIMDYNKRIITFPNYKVTDASIINISSEPRMVRKCLLLLMMKKQNMKLNHEETAQHQ